MVQSEVTASSNDAPNEQQSIAIFVCYRRGDSQHAAGRIYDRLVQRFGEDGVFMDVDAIPLGVDFGAFIDEAVRGCDAFISVIGDHWLYQDEHARRRIDDPTDYVRLEIAAALRRNVPVIPVLIDGASMPRAEDLPPEIRPLATRNGLELRHQRFNTDVLRLLEALEPILNGSARRSSARELASVHHGPSRSLGVTLQQELAMPQTALRRPSLAFGAEHSDTKQPHSPGGTRRWPAMAWFMLVCGAVVTLLWAAPGMRKSTALPIARSSPVAASGATAVILPAAAQASAVRADVPVGVSANPRSAASTSGRSQSGKMVHIPAGSFMMGSTEGGANEKPVHRVNIAAFEMDLNEVTVKAYRACVAAGACEMRNTVYSVWFVKYGEAEKWSRACNYDKADRDNHPINCVNWNDAETFCKWAGKRLPSEAEWEYAARGSNNGHYPWGNELPSPQRLNACGAECTSWVKNNIGWNWSPMSDKSDPWPTTAPVGSFLSGDSPFGLHDMAGNVWEWTASRYCPYETTDCETDEFVRRGGSWDATGPSHVSAARRSGSDPTDRAFGIGFRCAR